jgi:hypothetical protein
MDPHRELVIDTEHGDIKRDDRRDRTFEDEPPAPERCPKIVAHQHTPNQLRAIGDGVRKARFEHGKRTLEGNCRI